MVKDDAYGLNAFEVAKALYENAECRNFWVAHALEGARIAEAVPEANIYVLQGIGSDSWNLFEEYQLIPVIGSPAMLAFWKKHPIADVKPVIQVETGLNRLGFRPEELKKLSKADLKIFGMVMNISEGPALSFPGSPPEKANTAGMIIRLARMAIAVSKIST